MNYEIKWVRDMKLFLIDNNKITRYRLPEKIEDSFSVSYSTEDINDIIISIVNSKNGLCLQSNGTANVISDNQEVLQIKIELFHRYAIKIIGTKNLIDAYFLPSSQGLSKYSVQDITGFSVGKDPDCQICYDSILVAPVEIEFRKVNTDWEFSCVNDERYKVFLNDVRADRSKLRFGDVLFIEGLSIVWMNSFICINQTNKKIKITGLVPIADTKKPHEKLLPVKEEDKVVDLYSSDDYYVPYPTIREFVSDKEIVIEAPPALQSNESMPLILSMGSSLVMASSGFVSVFNLINNIQQGTATKANIVSQAVMSVSMVMGSLLMPTITRLYQNHRKKKKSKHRDQKYNEYLDKKTREIDIAIADETRILNDTYLDLNNCLTALDKKNANFYRFEYTDPNFLKIRLGIGRIKPKTIVKIPEEKFSLEDDALLSKVYQLREKYEYIDNVPVTVSLRQYPLTSFIFYQGINYNVLNYYLAQLVILQSSLNLKLVILTNKKNASHWQFAKYLPHVFTSDKGARYFATNYDEAKMVSSYLEEVIKERKELVENSEKNLDKKEPVAIRPHYLIITDDYKTYKSIPVVEEMVNKQISLYSFSMLVIDQTLKQAPLASDAFVEFGTGEGVFIEKTAGLNAQTLLKTETDNKEIEMLEIAKRLADVPILSKEASSTLPSSLSFLDMFGVSKIEQLNISNRWESNNPVLSLDTTVGVHQNGDKFKLDLHEKFHGPHGLIAGSTGSGKSEFIITYILSMIINYHPYEVQFVLIDYKGGGLAGAFENKETGVKIPHLVGTITNLDTSEMNRSLVSLESELKRRQRVFNEVRDELNEGTIDIYKYQKLYREGIVKKPMSHLFIISDEFAELKQQRPEFMEQLISTSRIGRSLGVHLILATQKPSGVVNDQIWANSKFKVCLKVQDRSDSMEMLKRPEAASIKEAGRFYLQVGYDELFEMGQSGWSGAKYVPSDKILVKIDESLNYIDNVGYADKSIKEDKDKVEDTTDHGTQLTNIVKYIYDLGEKLDIQTTNLWLPSIGENVYEEDLKIKYNYQSEPYYINPIIGELDDPVNQSQQLITLDISKKGNTLIYGIAGSGKEFLLTTILRSSIIDHTPEELNIYIIDCGSESLRIFGGFPHVGDVITSEDDEQIKDLIKMTASEIDRRKDLCAEYGGSYNKYNEATEEKLPVMLVVINNYDVFVENYSDEGEQLQSLFRDGYKYGVVFIVTAIGTNTIKSRSISYFNNKISLKLNDPNDYRLVVNARKELIPADYYGRGLIQTSNGTYEFQTAKFKDEQSETTALRELAKVLTNKYKTKARKIPAIPKVVLVEDLFQEAKSNVLIPFGYSTTNKKVAYFDFAKNNFITIAYNNNNFESISFIRSLCRLISKNASVYLYDFNKTIEEEIQNVNVIQGDFDESIEDVKFFVSNNKSSKEDIYLVLFGLANIKKRFGESGLKLFEEILASVSNTPYLHVILIDQISGYKNAKLESYGEYINTSDYLFIGSGISTQSVFVNPDIPYLSKNKNVPYMSYIVKQGNYDIIKHVVEKEDSNG